MVCFPYQVELCSTSFVLMTGYPPKCKFLIFSKDIKVQIFIKSSVNRLSLVEIQRCLSANIIKHKEYVLSINILFGTPVPFLIHANI